MFVYIWVVHDRRSPRVAFYLCVSPEGRGEGRCDGVEGVGEGFRLLIVPAEGGPFRGSGSTLVC